MLAIFVTLMIVKNPKEGLIMSNLTPFQTHMKNKNLDLLYIDDPSTVAYLTGYQSNPHERVLAVLLFQDTLWMIVPALEYASVKGAVPVDRLISYEDGQSPWLFLKEALSEEEISIQTVGIHELTLSVTRYRALLSTLEKVTFVDITEMTQHLQAIKQAHEIDIMKEAGALADLALKIGMDALKTNITEEEVVSIIESAMKKRGVKEMSFDTMVLFGSNAASPHGSPGNNPLQPGQLVLFDLGVVHKGYTSDVTRTVAYGHVSQQSKDVYQVVLTAQEQAQASVRPGITAGELDSIARSVIEEAGYGKFFTHRLGHGLGMSVHEYPNIAPSDQTVIEKGFCFSLEPGIYIENEVGVRIEDCIVVTENGCEAFTHTPKDLITIEVKS